MINFLADVVVFIFAVTVLFGGLGLWLIGAEYVLRLVGVL